MGKLQKHEVAFLAGWAAIVATVVLWERGGGVQAALTNTAGFLESTGRLSGLVAAVLLALQVLSMSRMPLLEQAAGQDRLTRWHRWSGFWSLWLMLAHIVLLTLAYSLTQNTTIVGQFVELVMTWPGMLLALAGTALVIMVAFTSIRYARRKLRYESWHLLHLYAYLGVAFALPHQLWVGTDLFGNTWGRWFWYALHGSALGAVLVYRALIPLWRSWRAKLEVVSVVRTGTDSISITFRGRDLHKLNAKAGQFFVWRFMTGKGWSVGHPFSMSAPVHRDHTRITVGTKGDDAQRLASLPPGTRVMIEGPYGVMTRHSTHKPKAAFFGSGIGLAPLLAMLHHEARSGNATDMTLVHRVSKPEDAPHREELEELARMGIHWYELSGPRARGANAWAPSKYASLSSEELLGSMLGDVSEYDFYVCGPGPWSQSLLESLREVGVKETAIHHETFSW